MLSFTLQGALGARLVGRSIDSAWVQAAGGALCVLLPMLLARVGHTALCSHWLLLWALLLATRTPPAGRWHWTVLALVAGMVQPYLAAMVLAIAVAALVGRSPWPLARRVGTLVATIAAMALGWWLSGLFVLGGGDTFTEGGLGYFSMNLLALITPQGWSRFLPAVPVAGPGQEGEGFTYLGAGVLALVVLAVGLAVAARRSHRPAPPRVWPPLVGAAAVAMAIFALSPVVTFGSRVLLDLNGPWAAPLATFRSSGRFVWPLVYLLVVWAVVTVARRLPYPAACAVLGPRRGAAGGRFARRACPAPSRRPRSGLPRLAAALRRRSLGVLAPALPPCRAGAGATMRRPHRSATNRRCGWLPSTADGQRGRHRAPRPAAQRQYCADADAAIDAVRLRDDTIYVVSESAAGVSRGGRRSRRRVRPHLDAVWMCTTAAAHGAWAGAAPFD